MDAQYVEKMYPGFVVAVPGMTRIVSAVPVLVAHTQYIEHIEAPMVEIDTDLDPSKPLQEVTIDNIRCQELQCSVTLHCKRLQANVAFVRDFGDKPEVEGMVGMLLTTYPYKGNGKLRVGFPAVVTDFDVANDSTNMCCLLVKIKPDYKTFGINMLHALAGVPLMSDLGGKVATFCNAAERGELPTVKYRPARYLTIANMPMYIIPLLCNRVGNIELAALVASVTCLMQARDRAMEAAEDGTLGLDDWHRWYVPDEVGQNPPKDGTNG